MTGHLSAESAYHGFNLAYGNLNKNYEILNSINVFPIADRDTGTNMEVSMGRVSELLEIKDTAAAVFENSAEILLQNGRGNSGTILTLFFAGFASYAAQSGGFSVRVFAEALKKGFENAYNGISNPMPGTILTIFEKISQIAANDVAENPNIGFEELSDKIADGAFDALPLTANQNPTLGEYKVIDSGALGFCMILDGFAAAFNLRDEVKRDYSVFYNVDLDIDDENSKYGFCAEFVVERPKNGYDTIIKNQLEKLGDCIIPVTDSKNLKCHIHTDRPEAVFFIASLCGRLKMRKVDNLRAEVNCAREEYVFFSKEKLCADGVRSMGHELVFSAEENQRDAAISEIKRLTDDGVSVVLFTSTGLSDRAEKDIPRIRYFADDDMMIEYLFGKM